MEMERYLLEMNIYDKCKLLGKIYACCVGCFVFNKQFYIILKSIPLKRKKRLTYLVNNKNRLSPWPYEVFKFSETLNNHKPRT